jgi:hypothetical protein
MWANYLAIDDIHADLMQTISATQSFFMAMAIYPQVQRRAQEEIDAITGGTRLPGTICRR